MTDAIKGAVKSMVMMNKRMKMPKLQVRGVRLFCSLVSPSKRQRRLLYGMELMSALLLLFLNVSGVCWHCLQAMMQEFAVESMRLDDTMEAMGDMMDDVMEDDEAVGAHGVCGRAFVVFDCVAAGGGRHCGGRPQ